MKSQDSSPYYEHHALNSLGRSELAPDRSELIPFLLEVKTNGRILDLGCGLGMDLELMHRSGHQAVGVEISPKLAELARTRNAGVEILEKNFLFLSLKDSEFDGIWANRSLHHFEAEAVQRVIATAFKGLKSGGVLGVVVYEGSESFQDCGNDHLSPTRWIHPFSENALCSMIEQTGFKILKIGKQKQVAPHPLPSMLILARKV